MVIHFHEGQASAFSLARTVCVYVRELTRQEPRAIVALVAILRDKALSSAEEVMIIYLIKSELRVEVERVEEANIPSGDGTAAGFLFKYLFLHQQLSNLVGKLNYLVTNVLRQKYFLKVEEKAFLDSSINNAEDVRLSI